MKTTQPLLNYLATCSEASLQSFELARLNDVANLRQQLLEQMMTTVDQMIEAEIQARLAQWVHNRRRRTPRRSTQRDRRSRAIRDAQFPLPLLSRADSHPLECPPLRADRLLRLTKPAGSPFSSASLPRLKLASAG
jgi:hypothetical protein